MPGMLTVRPPKTWSCREQRRCQLEVALDHVEERALPSCWLRTGFESFRCALPDRGLATRRSEPAAKPQHTRTGAPRALKPLGQILATELLRSERGTVQHLPSRVVLDGDETDRPLESRKPTLTS